MMRSASTPRVLFEAPVILSVGQPATVVTGRSLNLSVGGIFVRSGSAFPCTTRVRLRFDLPGEGLIGGDATVVRVVDGEGEQHPSGMALRFDGLDDDGELRLERYIEQLVQPALGERIRLQVQGLSSPMVATAHHQRENTLSIDAALPFLRLGTEVQLQAGEPSDEAYAGAIRWVTVNVCPQSGIPRLNLGIELAGEGDSAPCEDEWDPVHTEKFVRYVAARDRELRGAEPSGGA